MRGAYRADAAYLMSAARGRAAPHGHSTLRAWRVGFGGVHAWVCVEGVLNEGKLSRLDHPVRLFRGKLLYRKTFDRPFNSARHDDYWELNQLIGFVDSHAWQFRSFRERDNDRKIKIRECLPVPVAVCREIKRMQWFVGCR
jgi:hypothetical protein